MYASRRVHRARNEALPGRPRRSEATPRRSRLGLSPPPASHRDASLREFPRVEVLCARPGGPSKDPFPFLTVVQACGEIFKIRGIGKSGHPGELGGRVVGESVRTRVKPRYSKRVDHWAKPFRRRGVEDEPKLAGCLPRVREGLGLIRRPNLSDKGGGPAPVESDPFTQSPLSDVDRQAIVGVCCSEPFIDLTQVDVVRGEQPKRSFRGSHRVEPTVRRRVRRVGPPHPSAFRLR